MSSNQGTYLHAKSCFSTNHKGQKICIQTKHYHYALLRHHPTALGAASNFTFVFVRTDPFLHYRVSIHYKEKFSWGTYLLDLALQEDPYKLRMHSSPPPLSH
jgi:hypothetical protein